MNKDFEEEYHCPLLGKTIDFAYCYEINSVAVGFIKADCLEDAVDKTKALQFCDQCPNNQMWSTSK